MAFIPAPLGLRPLLMQGQKAALLRLAGSSEEPGFAERFQRFLLARHREAGPEGDWHHMAAPRPDQEPYERLCRRILAALALSALLQEVRCFRQDGAQQVGRRRSKFAVVVLHSQQTLCLPFPVGHCRARPRRRCKPTLTTRRKAVAAFLSCE